MRTKCECPFSRHQICELLSPFYARPLSISEFALHTFKECRKLNKKSRLYERGHNTETFGLIRLLYNNHKTFKTDSYCVPILYTPFCQLGKLFCYVDNNRIFVRANIVEPL